MKYPFGFLGVTFLTKLDSVYFHSEILINGNIREIRCDKEEKWMKVWSFSGKSTKWDELDVANLRRGDTIDLNENGERWEGDSLNGNPFGYSCIYNSDNQLIYSGFIYEGLKVCYGIELYGDVSLVEYEGEFNKGMRYGNGKLCNKKNELIYEGEWYMNNPSEIKSIRIERELKEEDIHFGLEEIEIGKECLDNLECFKLIGYDHLKTLIIHENSLKRMNCFCIEDCNELVCVNFEADNSISNDNDLETSKEKYNKLQRVFRIMNCRNLKDLYVSEGWFRYFNSAEINS